MSKKVTKTVQAVEETKKDFVGLSQQLKIESPSSKISNASTKEEFEALFQEWRSS